MKINIITSCTGKKAFTCADQLTLDDFKRGKDHVAVREGELAEFVAPAEEMYTGEQHLRLMRGVKHARNAGNEVDIWIVSAGYGVIHGSERIAPYNVTFSDMHSAELSDWALHLGVHQSLCKLLRQPVDGSLVLLGDRYLRAAALEHITEMANPAWAICGAGSTSRFGSAFKLHRLAQSDTTRFRVGMVGLKGEVAARALEDISQGLGRSLQRLKSS